MTFYHELDDTYYSVTSSTFIGQLYDMVDRSTSPIRRRRWRLPAAVRRVHHRRRSRPHLPGGHECRGSRSDRRRSDRVGIGSRRGAGRRDPAGRGRLQRWARASSSSRGPSRVPSTTRGPTRHEPEDRRARPRRRSCPARSSRGAGGSGRHRTRTWDPLAVLVRGAALRPDGAAGDDPRRPATPEGDRRGSGRGGASRSGAAYQRLPQPARRSLPGGAAAGAGLGRTIAVVFGLSSAFAVALPDRRIRRGAPRASVSPTASVVRGCGRSTTSLILGGVAVASFLTAVQTLIQQQRSETLRQVYSWIPRLGTTGWDDLTCGAAVAVATSRSCGSSAACST